MAVGEIIAKIRSTMPFFSKSEKKIATYILDHPNDVSVLSVSALSRKIGVSDPTLIRFTRKLGLAGYKEFKLKITADIISDSSSDSPVNVTNKDNAWDIYNKLAVYTTSSITSTSRALNSVDLQKAVDYIDKAHQNNKQIFLSGMGSSSMVAESFQVKLMRLNIQSVFYSDIHLRLEACSNLGQGDLFICFSTLGKSKENYELVDVANSKGADVIVITQLGNSKLAKKATVTLYTSVMENNSRIITQASTIVQTLISDTIFLTLAQKDSAAIEASVKETREIFKKTGHYT